MKKIIVTILTLSYLVISFIYLQIYGINELESIYTKNVESINVIDWEKDLDNERKLSQIEDLSKDENINIYKVVYNQRNNSDKVIIDVYTTVVDENALKEKFNIKYDDSIEKLFLNGGYLSSKNGEVELFNSNLEVRIKSLLEAKNENIIGQYLIQASDKNKVQNIKMNFVETLKFTLQDNSNESANINNGNNLLNNVEAKYIILLSIVIIAILLAFIYYIVFRYKEFAIKKMLGYSDGKIIFKELLKESLIMHCSTLIGSSLILLIYLYFYNNLKCTIDFFSKLMIISIIFSLILLSVEIVIFLNVDNIKINAMLKNKKPIGVIQFLNYITKIVFSVTLVTIIVSLASNFSALMNENKNLNKWKNTNEYVYFLISYKYRDTDMTDWEFKIDEKCKSLFKEYNDKGGLLIKPSDYILYNQFFTEEELKNRKEYDPNTGNVLQVNSEYLRQNPIYDVNNKQVSIEDEYGDYLIILVPEKYKEIEDELLESYKEWYEFKRFFSEDSYNEYMNIEVEDHPEVKIEIIYTKNGQESFLYDPLLEVENQNLVTDAIHIIINSENIGADNFSNYVSSQRFFAKVDGSLEGEALFKVSDVIEELNMEKIILEAYTLYSTVDSYIYELQNEIKDYVTSMIIVLILELLLTIYMVINYIQRNNYINAIKKINGYSYIGRHNKFILLTIAMWVSILVFGYLLGMVSLIGIIQIIIPITLLELLIVYVVLKNIEDSEILSVLKLK